MAIEDYFEGSGKAYGQLAGSLLAGRKKQDKKEAKRALIASTVLSTFGAFQKQQKQNIIDGAEDVKEKYAEIFNLNTTEFEAYDEERKLFKKYNTNKETFLNEEVAKIIDNTDEAVSARVTWKDVDNQPEELRNSMYSAFNEEKEKLKNKMENYATDKRITSKTVTQFNQRAMDEYKAAIALVEDDPTKKGLIKEAWNRIFKTERNEDGELVTKNVELLQLQKDLKDAKENRTTFRDSIENQVAKKHLFEPLIFKDKPRDRAEIYAISIPALKSAFKDDENYKNVDNNFYVEIVDSIIKENPQFDAKKVSETAFMQVISGEISAEGYLTTQGIKIANQEALITAFENTEDKKSFIDNNPFKLFQLMDAYDAKGDEKMSTGLATQYQDVISREAETYKISQADKQANVERIRNRLDPKNKTDSSILNSTDTLGILAANTAYAENYYKKNNPNWDEMYTEVNLKEAAITFVMSNAESNATEIRMTDGDLIGMRTGGFSVDLIEELPSILKQYKSVNAPKEKIEALRKEFINELSNKKLSLEIDEIADFTNTINNYFKDENIEVNDEEENNNTNNKITFKDTTVDYKNKGVIKFHTGRKLNYLTNYKEKVNALDFSNMSVDNLGYLYTLSETDIKKHLGLQSNISLMPFRVQSDTKFLRNKVFDAIEQTYIDRGDSKFRANGIVKGIFMNKDNDWKTLKDDMVIDSFFENFKNNILS